MSQTDNSLEAKSQWVKISSFAPYFIHYNQRRRCKEAIGNFFGDRLQRQEEKAKFGGVGQGISGNG